MVGRIALVGALGVAIVLGAQAVRPTPEEAGEDQIAPLESVLPTLEPGTPPSVLRVADPRGLWLFYGGVDRLQRIDLDTGEHEVVGMRARPILVTGSELVLATVDRPLIGWASLNDPSEMPDGWRQARVATSDIAGSVWLHLTDSSSWMLSDLVAMRDGKTTELPPGIDLGRQPSFADGMLLHGRDLAVVDGRIYEHDRAGWNEVTSGWLVGFTDRAALVERCATLTSCHRTWYRRRDWSPLRGAPDVEAALAGGEVAAVVADMTDTTQERQPFVGAALLAGLADDDVSVCCDQHWLAARVGDRVGLFDVVNGQLVAWFDGLLVEDGGRILLVEKPG